MDRAEELLGHLSPAARNIEIDPFDVRSMPGMAVPTGRARIEQPQLNRLFQTVVHSLDEEKKNGGPQILRPALRRMIATSTHVSQPPPLQSMEGVISPPATGSRVPLPSPQTPMPLASHVREMFREVRHVVRHEQRMGAEPVLQPALEATLNEGSSVDHMASVAQCLREAGSTKSWWPVIYALMANAGRIGYGIGPILLERELLRAHQPALPGQVTEDGPKPPSVPYAQAAAVPGNVALGATSTILGVGLGVLAALGCYLQARKNNPKRAAINVSLHMLAITIIVGHRFFIQWIEFNKPPSVLMPASVPGIVATGLFGYTVPHGLAAAETRLGLMPVGSMEVRTELAIVLVAVGAGMFTVWGMLVAHHGMNPYVREGCLIVATLMLSTGTAFALTHARTYSATMRRGYANIMAAQQRKRTLSLAEQGGQPATVRARNALAGLRRGTLGNLFSARGAAPADASRSRRASETQMHEFFRMENADQAMRRRTWRNSAPEALQSPLSDVKEDSGTGLEQESHGLAATVGYFSLPSETRRA